MLSQSKTKNPNDFIVLVDITLRLKVALMTLMPHRPLSQFNQFYHCLQFSTFNVSQEALKVLAHDSHGTQLFPIPLIYRFQTQFQTRNCDLKLPRPQPVRVGEPSLSSCPTSQQQSIHQKVIRENRDSPWAQSAFYRGIAEITLCQSISKK